MADVIKIPNGSNPRQRPPTPAELHVADAHRHLDELQAKLDADRLAKLAFPAGPAAQSRRPSGDFRWKCW